MHPWKFLSIFSLEYIKVFGFRTQYLLFHIAFPFSLYLYKKPCFLIIVSFINRLLVFIISTLAEDNFVKVCGMFELGGNGAYSLFLRLILPLKMRPLKF